MPTIYSCRSRSSSSVGLQAVWVLPLLSLLLAGFWVWPCNAEGLSAREQRGKQIYFEGSSPSGAEIKAYVGEEAMELPGTAAACAGCHGVDGRGRPEGGVVPADITWDHLMKPYGHLHPMGRKHPAFTVASLRRSILTGYDPAGNRLDATMPTYSMSADDLDDLLAYLQRLQSDFDPGITETRVRLGITVPAAGRPEEIGEGVYAVMAAYFAELNSHGGIFGRQVDLVKSVLDPAKQSDLSGATRRIEEQNVFALAGSVMTGEEQEIAQFVERRGIPFVGLFSLPSSDPFALNEFTFYLFSGRNEQIRALVEFSIQRMKPQRPHIAVLASSGLQDRAVEAAIDAQGKLHGWESATEVRWAGDHSKPETLAQSLQKDGVSAVLQLSYQDLPSLLQEAEKIGWQPLVLIPGPQVQPELLSAPGVFQHRICLAYPILPTESTPSGMQEFQTLLTKHRIPLKHWASQASAFVAAKVLAEGLKGGGRDLSRKRFMDALEGLREFQTGLVSPISYGPNRRIGTLGSHIVTIDLIGKRFVPVAWIALSAIYESSRK